MCLDWVFPTQKGYKRHHPPRIAFVSVNVTFQEYEPYLSITPSPLPRENYKEEEMAFPSTIESEIEEWIQGETVRCLDKPDLKTYSWRNRAEEAIKQPAKAESSFSGE